MSRRRWPYADADADPVAGGGLPPPLLLLLARTRRRGSKTGETKPVGNDPSSSSGFDDSAYSAAYSYVCSPADDADMYELCVDGNGEAYPAAEDAADTHARPPAHPLRGVAAGSMVVPMPPIIFPPSPPPPSAELLRPESRPECRSRAAMRAAIRSAPPAVGETRAGMRVGGAAPPVIIAAVVFVVFVFVMGRILLVLPVVVMVVVLVSLVYRRTLVLCWF